MALRNLQPRRQLFLCSLLVGNTCPSPATKLPWLPITQGRKLSCLAQHTQPSGSGPRGASLISALQPLAWGHTRPTGHMHLWALVFAAFIAWYPSLGILSPYQVRCCPYHPSWLSSNATSSRSLLCFSQLGNNFFLPKNCSHTTLTLGTSSLVIQLFTSFALSDSCLCILKGRYYSCFGPELGIW